MLKWGIFNASVLVNEHAGNNNNNFIDPYT